MLVSGPRQPAFAAYLDEDGQIAPMRPTLFPNDYPSRAMVEPQEVIFQAEDGIAIHGQLFLPSNYDPAQKYPGVLFFHGGSRRQMYLGFHDRGYYHNAYAMNQYLASQGFMVLSVNYRSGVGYGMEFREALNYGANGASEYKDVVAAAKFLQNRSDVDAQRLGLWGGSYGGYLTAMGLARNSDIFKAGVDVHGVHDWNAIIRNFQPGYNPDRQAEVAKRAFESSPMYFVDGWKSPVLFIHGDDDRNVPFSETVDIIEALRKRGVHYEQLIYPDDVHGFLLHENWLRTYEATAEFLGRYLGGN
jgi:dipeptidyl aminopeptidase/acylaminoacyl peptidase